MDREKMAHELAVAFAVSQQNVKFDKPQVQLQKMLEDYCAAYGFFQKHSEEYITELTRRGE